MRLDNVSFHRTIPLLFTLMSAFGRGRALTQTYCSSENTGSDYSDVSNIWQSNGACYDQCSSNYAFAVVQYQSCWCANYIPANQLDVSQCSTDCPGYPDEKCGNVDRGLYGYVALNRRPSGIARSSSAAASSTQASSSTQQPTTSTSTSAPSTTSTSSVPSSTSSTSSTTPSAVATTTSAASSSTSGSSSFSHTTIVSTRIITESGAAVTQTVTSTPIVNPNADAQQTVRKGVSSGALAGAVIGAVVGVVLLLLGAFFLWRRRRSNSPDPEIPKSPRRSPKRMERNTSVLSKTGLLAPSAYAGGDAEKSYDDPPPPFMAGVAQRQRNSALFNHGNSVGPSPVSPIGAFDRDAEDDRRNSRPLVYDQRLNPAALMQNWQHNGSRASVGTMQDQRDYSRPLGVTNPDPVDD